MNATEQSGSNGATDTNNSEGRFVAQSSLVQRRPDEVVPTLSRIEFKVLQDGEISAAKSGRDLCIGIAFTGLIGSIGLCFTIDWDTSFHLAHWKPFIWTGLLFAITAASAVGALIYWCRYRNTLNSSAYSDIMKRLADHFSNQDSHIPTK
jgi:hypothetical protein